jgi:hypothetical protein
MLVPPKKCRRHSGADAAAAPINAPPPAVGAASGCAAIFVLELEMLWNAMLKIRKPQKNYRGGRGGTDAAAAPMLLCWWSGLYQALRHIFY